MNILKTILILIAFSSCRNEVPPVKTGFEGKRPPEFKLLLSDSSTYIEASKLSSDSPTVYFYFSPHCPYSHAQMKDIIKNINRLGNIHFYVFTTWPFNEMKKFCSTYELYKYKNITTGVDNAYTFEHFFNATGVPYFAIYKKDKTLSHAFLGKISIDQIKAATQN